jgi:Arc/MetJ family transcription regulator
MSILIASRIMRTTIDLDASVVQQLKQRSRRTGKSMGQIASELLARSLHDADKGAAAPRLAWVAGDLGLPYVDLEDKEAVRATLDPAR